MRNLPTVTKNLLLINLIVWLLDGVLSNRGIHLSGILGLFPLTGGMFHIWQPLTYMFMHAGFSHLFFNMFAVWMFGPVLEREWGEKKYLTYYLVCGLGAAIVQMLVWWVLKIDYSCTIGASGAVFGILFAFGWLFPDVEMMLLFPPIPMRARTFVILYAAVELFLGIGSVTGGALFSADHVAHFAHLGGMLFGWLLLLWWRRPRRFPRLDDTEDRDKDYSGYHYQRRV